MFEVFNCLSAFSKYKILVVIINSKCFLTGSSNKFAENTLLIDEKI